jgi:hypothetical protein
MKIENTKDFAIMTATISGIAFVFQAAFEAGSKVAKLVNDGCGFRQD